LLLSIWIHFIVVSDCIFFKKSEGRGGQDHTFPRAHHCLQVALFTRLCHWTLSWARWIQSKSLHPILLVSVLILSCLLCLCVGCAIAQAVYSLQRPRFTPRAVHVGFVVEIVALGQVFPKPFGFSLSVSLHLCSIFTHVSAGGWTLGLLAATMSWRHSLTPLKP
jgi:hypothetical protein